MKYVGTFVRIDDPYNHTKGFHPMPDFNDSIARIAAINLTRSNKWHPKGLASWSLSDWAVALAGEVGELCNVIKKLNRERDGLIGNRVAHNDLMRSLAEEIADVYLYLDLLAQVSGFDLNNIVRDKFNATSERLGFPERL